jgi:hypothetical protein
MSLASPMCACERGPQLVDSRTGPQDVLYTATALVY